MKLLIATPFLSVIGGTEIETLITAQELAASGKFGTIQIFHPYELGLEDLKNIIENPKISFFSYPDIFKNKYVKKSVRFILRWFNFPAKSVEELYWYLKPNKEFDFIYILTSTSDNYYIPILKNFEPEKCLMKFTLVYNRSLPSWKGDFLKNVKQNIVASSKQKVFFKEVFNLSNVVVQDVLIANEKKLLKCNSNRQYTFGILCRFSREKQIEHSILLIKTLNDQGAEANLIIQGEGDEGYQREIEEMISRYQLQESITLINKNIPPLMTRFFYEKISFFLITSQFETGPMTGLEAMAAGIPVLSYDVGAMKERLGDKNYLVVNSFNNIVELAGNLINLNHSDYQQLSTSLRSRYVSHCSNAAKVKKLENLFFDKI